MPKQNVPNARNQTQLDASAFKGASAKKPDGNAHVGDAIQAWDEMLNDQGHTHYLILCYDDRKEKVEVFAKGGDYGKLSSREECLNRVKELYNQDIPCWGAYSFRGVKNDNPGEKDHDMHYAAFLLWPQHHHIEKHLYQGIQAVKNVVRSKVFHNADVFVEVHDFAGVCDEEQWKRHQGATAKGAKYADFGGGDKMNAKSKSKQPNLSTELADRAETMGRRKSQQHAQQLANEEQDRRIQDMLRQQMQQEAERLVNQEVSLEMMEKERSRRIAEDGKANVGSEESAIRHSMLMKELFSANHMEKMDDRTRNAARKMARDMLEQSQFDRVNDWKALEEQAEKIRQFAQDKARAHAQDEQARRLDDHDAEHERLQNAKRCSAHIHSELCEASAGMEREHHKRSSLSAMDDEQSRRVDENGNAYKPKLNAREARKRQSMHEEVVKVVRIINHHDRMGNLTTTTSTTETAFKPSQR